jgi:hypothetical protein
MGNPLSSKAEPADPTDKAEPADPTPCHEVDMGDGYWKIIVVVQPQSSRNPTDEWKFEEYDYHEDWLKESVEDMNDEELSVEDTKPLVDIKLEDPEDPEDPTQVDPKPILEDPKQILEDPKPILEDPKPILEEPTLVDPKPILEDPEEPTLVRKSSGYNPIKDTIWTESNNKWEYYMDGCIMYEPEPIEVKPKDIEVIDRDESEEGEMEEKSEEYDEPDSPREFEYAKGDIIEFRKNGYWYMGEIDEAYNRQYTITFVNDLGNKAVLYDVKDEDVRGFSGDLLGYVDNCPCEVLWNGEWYYATIKEGCSSFAPHVQYVDHRYYGYCEYNVDPNRIRYEDEDNY